MTPLRGPGWETWGHTGSREPEIKRQGWGETLSALSPPRQPQNSSSWEPSPVLPALQNIPRKAEGADVLS